MPTVALVGIPAVAAVITVVPSVGTVVVGVTALTPIITGLMNCAAVVVALHTAPYNTIAVVALTYDMQIQIGVSSIGVHGLTNALVVATFTVGALVVFAVCA
jgi:hypothetical protein